jgi:hypothetical protein
VFGVDSRFGEALSGSPAEAHVSTCAMEFRALRKLSVIAVFQKTV